MRELVASKSPMQEYFFEKFFIKKESDVDQKCVSTWRKENSKEGVSVGGIKSFIFLILNWSES